jgi:alpha-1,3-glucan synthase
MFKPQSSDHFIFRIGQYDNPMVFPQNASHAEGILHRGSDGGLTLSHRAAGSDQFRYSLNWGSSYSDWQPYHGGDVSLAPQPWSGTRRQDWTGVHVIMQYHSRIAGTSDAVQHADLDPNITRRRFPHLFLNGLFNMFGLDGGIYNALKLQNKQGAARWTYSLLAEWPTSFQINVWGINPDGQPDKTGVFGDIDGDNVLDRLSPVALAPALINITEAPPSPHLAWQISLDDANYRYDIIPVGNRTTQMIIYFIMWCIPLTTAALVVWFYTLS